MAEENSYIARLREVRAKLTEDRRHAADRMITSTTTAASIQAPGFAQLQNAIEAIDRAIDDERRIVSDKPIDYGSALGK